MAKLKISIELDEVQYFTFKKYLAGAMNSPAVHPFARKSVSYIYHDKFDSDVYTKQAYSLPVDRAYTLYHLIFNDNWERYNETYTLTLRHVIAQLDKQLEPMFMAENQYDETMAKSIVC